jgi:hypothetical protein
MNPTLTIVAFILGLVGTVLGITNGVRQILASRVRLRVKCYGLAVIQPDKTIQSWFCVEIANLSSFPITATKVNFIHINDPRMIMSMLDDGCFDGKRLPRRIDPRDSIIICYKRDVSTMLNQSHHVLVETACGEKRKGSLREWKKIHLKEEPESRAHEQSVANSQPR